MHIQPRAAAFGTESAFKILARARELEAGGRDIIHLEIGQPDFPTPAPICEAAIRALREGKTGYGPTPGLPELRRAIARAAGELRGLSFAPEQVIVTPGGKPILFYAINALAGHGDEVVYPDPCFPMYPSIIAYSGATPVPLRLREERGFRFDVEEFRRLLSPRTRLIILNSPENPTGGVLEAADLEVIAGEARARDITVLSDEIYSRILYQGRFASIASVPGAAARTIILDGFSKTYSMTGWRLGYGIATPDLIEVFERYSVNIVSCVTTFAQYGALEALAMDQAPVEAMVAEFRARRDLLVDGLNRIPGVRCVRPAGAFYAFPNVRGTGLDSRDLARRLLEEAGVATLSGDAFGPGGEGYLRLSYANSRTNLEIALRRIEEFLKKL
jgi:aspartate/methionine/tyrosine aminotransferase